MNIKLLPEDWINEAFAMLAEGGVDSIKIEVLAKRLNVTKGGFYWHFKNRGDLLERMLEHWCQRRIETIRGQVARETDPVATLNYLLGLYTDQTNPRGNAIELAVRSWARQSEAAAATIAVVDRERLAAVAGLFRSLGCADAEAEARAYLFYSYCFGQSLLAVGHQDELDQIRLLCGRLLVTDSAHK
ncbi:TetR/AcrR family transcriptional regulator [Motiliproteus sediminis]|uniref:TetR/AcrR family transcriptional regulator n=1 Tax=Motiliproteus sediminis TaxID=1468178 RepID=UPI001AEF3CF5|nr:TetR/AcrR family transcriptional regulator [Motiliproteus sediminis]